MSTLTNIKITSSRIGLSINAILSRWRLFLACVLFFGTIVTSCRVLAQPPILVRIDGGIHVDTMGMVQKRAFTTTGESTGVMSSYQDEYADNLQKGSRAMQVQCTSNGSLDANGEPQMTITIDLKGETVWSTTRQDWTSAWYGIWSPITLEIYAAAPLHQTKVSGRTTGRVSIQQNGQLDVKCGLTSPSFSRAFYISEPFDNTFGTDWEFLYQKGQGNQISDIIPVSGDCAYNLIARMRIDAYPHVIKAGDGPASGEAKVEMLVTVNVATRQVKPINFKREPVSGLAKLKGMIFTMATWSLKEILIEPSDKHLGDHLYTSITWDSSTGNLADLQGAFVYEALKKVGGNPIEGKESDLLEGPFPFMQVGSKEFKWWAGWNAASGDGDDRLSVSEIDPFMEQRDGYIDLLKKADFSIVQRYYWLAPWVRGCDGRQLVGTGTYTLDGLKNTFLPQGANLQPQLLLEDTIRETMRRTPFGYVRSIESATGGAKEFPEHVGWSQPVIFSRQGIFAKGHLGAGEPVQQAYLNIIRTRPGTKFIEMSTELGGPWKPVTVGTELRISQPEGSEALFFRSP